MKKRNKIILTILISFLSLILMAFILPFCINLNYFKPQIQNIVSKNANAKIEFSSIRLTILTGLGFKLKNIIIENTDSHFLNTKILQVDEVTFKIGILPLLIGKIDGYLKINSPNIQIVKNNDKNNILLLLPNNTDTKKIENKIENDLNLTDNEKKSHDNIKTTTSTNNINKFDKIQFSSIIIQNASITYSEVASAPTLSTFSMHAKPLTSPKKFNPIVIKDLNIALYDVGLNKKMKIMINTNLNVKNDDYTIQGPVQYKGTIKTIMQANNWQESSFNGELNLDNLFIDYKKFISKSNHNPFHFSFEGITKPNYLVMQNFKLFLNDLDLDAIIALKNFNTLNSKIKIDLSSKDVSSLAPLFPQHKDLFSDGNFKISSNIQGFLTNIDSLTSSTKILANFSNADLNLFIDENSISPLKLNIHLISKEFDVNKVLKPFILSTNKNSFLLSEFNDVILNNCYIDAEINNNKINIKNLKSSAFNGSLNSNFKLDLDDNPISYSGVVDLKNIQIQNLVKLFKLKSNQNPIEGITNLAFNFNGKGTTQDVISKYLNSRGHFFFTSGKLNFKNILQTTANELKKYLDKTEIKALNLGFSQINKIDFKQNEIIDLKDVTGEFAIINGKLILNNDFTSEAGNLALNVAVGIDDSINGNAIYTANKDAMTHLLKQNKNFAYLFNNKKEFKINLILSGNIDNLDIKIQTDELTKNLLQNATKEIKNQLKNNPEIKKIQGDVKKLLQGTGLDFGKFGM